MALFFFDIRLGEREAIDDKGIELTSADAAREEARAVLPEIAEEASGTHEAARLVLTVRDETGTSIFRGEAVAGSKTARARA